MQRIVFIGNFPFQRSKKLHDGKGEEPEWLLNIQLLHEEEADLSDSYIDQEQRTETPPSLEVPAAEEGKSEHIICTDTVFGHFNIQLVNS